MEGSLLDLMQKQIDQLTATIGNLEARLTSLEENLYRIAGAANDAVVRDRERITALEEQVDWRPRRAENKR